jgi:putative transposase
VTLLPGFGFLKEAPMPWQEVVTVELRQQFIHDALRRVVPVTELCAAYGISRKTGYKFLARYHARGSAGLADQSRRPHVHRE